MRDLSELGMHHFGGPIVTPEPTPSQIALVERLLGTPLPADYLAFLRHANGGHPTLDTFYIQRHGEQEPWTIDHFLRIASESLATEDPWDVLWNYRTLQPILPKAIVPIAEDAFGNMLLLDLTEEGSGRVLLWVRDEEWPVFEVAPSFESFIDSLTTYPGDLEALARGES
jgi:cell wall assembly regulator SMI1